LYIGKHLSYNDVIQYVSVSISSRILFLCVKNEIIINTYNINSIHLTCHVINIRCVSFKYTLEIFDVYFGSNLVHVFISALNETSKNIWWWTWYHTNSVTITVQWIIHHWQRLGPRWSYSSCLWIENTIIWH
jgi:hypothetical protein